MTRVVFPILISTTEPPLSVDCAVCGSHFQTPDNHPNPLILNPVCPCGEPFEVSRQMIMPAPRRSDAERIAATGAILESRATEEATCLRCGSVFHREPVRSVNDFGDDPIRNWCPSCGGPADDSH